MLVDRGRLELAMPVADWIGLAEAAPEIAFVPVGNRIAMASLHLTDWAHRDPADRIIVATAIELRATLVTADSRLRSYAAVETLWD